MVTVPLWQLFFKHMQAPGSVWSTLHRPNERPSKICGRPESSYELGTEPYVSLTQSSHTLHESLLALLHQRRYLARWLIVALSDVQTTARMATVRINGCRVEHYTAEYNVCMALYSPKPSTATRNPRAGVRETNHREPTGNSAGSYETTVLSGRLHCFLKILL